MKHPYTIRLCVKRAWAEAERLEKEAAEHRASGICELLDVAVECERQADYLRATFNNNARSEP